MRGPAPSRTELLRAKRRLERVRHGSDLLRRKRQGLVAELFRLASAAIDSRAAVEEEAQAFYPALLRALAVHGGDGLTIAGWPPRDVEVELRTIRTWGVGAAEIVARDPVRRGLPARGAAPTLTGIAAFEAGACLESLIELLLDAATREMRIRRLGQALSQTSRQLHTLEQRIAPALAARITLARQTLQEREREEHGRRKQLARSRARKRDGADAGGARAAREAGSEFRAS